MTTRIHPLFIFGLLIASLMAAMLLGQRAYAESTPSNETLYKLLLQQQKQLLEQQKQIKELQVRAEEAERQLESSAPKAVLENQLPATVTVTQAPVVQPEPTLAAPKREVEGWTGSVQVPALVVSSDALVVVKGDDDDGDTIGAQELGSVVEPGIDARLSYALANSRFSFGVGAKYWHASLVDNFNGVDIQPFIGVDRNVRSNRLAVEMNIDRLISDLDATYDLIDNGEAGLGVIFGIRGAYFRSGAEYLSLQAGVSDNDSLGSTTNSSVNFYGVGPRLGISGGLDMGRGFGLEGIASASMLFGHADIRTKQSSDLGVADDFRTTFVPIIELNVGLAYEHTFDEITAKMRLGGELEWWSNTPDHFRIHSSSGAEPMEGKDYLFFGPSLSLKATW